MTKNRQPNWVSRALGLLAIYAGFVSPGAPAQNATNGFWQGQSIYQIITDRFFDGNPANNNAEGTYAPTNLTGVHGGDFQGVEAKLDYIKGLGATAIWISPIVLNTEGQFHGYSARDFTMVAPHWGTLSNLQHFVRSAHARGLLVIQDMVVNHAGDLVISADPGYPNFVYPPAGYNLSYANKTNTYPAPFNLSALNPALTNLFHNNGNVQNYNDPTQLLLGQLDGLNDFRTETPYVQTQMASIYQSWIKQAGFDGFRVDTAMYVDMGFWQSWCPAIHSWAATNGYPNFFMFGEAFNGSESLVGSFTGNEDGGPYEMDSMLDYPLYFLVNSEFANPTAPTQYIESHYAAVDSSTDPTARTRLVTFLDNHDNPRFLSPSAGNGSTNRLALALVFLYTARGVPCLYYGTEQAFNGNTDPYDREDMFAGQFKDGPAGVDSFNMSHPLYVFVAQLNNLRRLYPALTLGSHVNQWSDASGPGLLAYSRVLNSEELFVVLNTSSSSQMLPARPLTYAPGTVLVNVLDTNETITLDASSQTPSLNVPSTTAKLFVAQSLWQPLDPQVVSNSPPHAATGLPTTSSIVLQFSTPMDTNSVQAAFGTVPQVSGTFGWSPAGDQVTFTPNGAGFLPLSTINVYVTNTAVAAGSGKSLYATYSMMFATTNTTEPGVYLASPADSGLVVPLNSNSTYTIHTCFTPTLDTNVVGLFNISINGVLQPQSSFTIRPPGAIAGCPGLRSLLYTWGPNSPGTMPGLNVIQVVYSNNVSGVVLSDVRTVVVPPALAVSASAANPEAISWSSTPGLDYVVLATTNLGQSFAPVSPVIPATGLSTSFTDVVSSALAPQKFYQIQVAP